MHRIAVAVAVLLFVAAIDARHFVDQSITEEGKEQNDHVRRARDHTANQMRRHKRRSWPANYGYEYPQPPNPYFPYPDNRRDYNPNQQADLLPQIYRLLDEISSYVRRPPPPPPQPIYIPYPVPYPVPQRCGCQPKNPTQPQPNITNRFPEMEDSNQNWGFVDTNQDDFDDGSDGVRPISFDPIVPKRPGNRKQPSVEHGSSQAGALTTQAPAVLNIKPSLCDVTALSCCAGPMEQQRQCFISAGCGPSFENGNACRQDRLLAIIDSYAKAYSPVTN